MTAWLSLALVAGCSALAGCSLLVGNEDRTFDPDAALVDARLASDAAPPGETGSTAPDGAAAITDAGSVAAPDSASSVPQDAAPLVDAAAPPPDDDAAPPPTCPPAGAPPGTLCCGAVACIGEACQHCTDCRSNGCASNEYCCVVVNGGGHVKSVACSATPTCP